MRIDEPIMNRHRNICGTRVSVLQITFESLGKDFVAIISPLNCYLFENMHFPRQMRIIMQR